jgi:hypothetical protein
MVGMKEGIFGHVLLAVCVVVLIICLSLICGCVEVGTDGGSQSPPGQDLSPPDRQSPLVPPPYSPDNSNAPLVNPSPIAIPGTGPGLATYTDPIPPGIAGNITHRVLNQTPEFFPRPFEYPTAPFFQEAYSLSWNNIALVANPDSPPFVIEFKVEAGTNNPYDARVLITVRDNATGLVVAEEGYNGAYSSDPVKRIIIRKAGEYHINLYGYRAGVHLILRGGVPENQAVPYGTFTTHVTQPIAEIPGDYYWEEGF